MKRTKLLATVILLIASVVGCSTIHNNQELDKLWSSNRERDTMGYYVRILSVSNNQASISEIKKLVEERGFKIEISSQGEQTNVFEELIVMDSKGNSIVALEKNEVAEGSLAEEELEEFAEEIEDAYPKSAVGWLQNYFKNVNTIYTLQIMSAAYQGNRWDAVDIVRDYIWNKVGGIIQADNEGFSNEEGFQILWQFADDVEGSWNMAVLDDNGKWITFEMDLGNKEHRKAFMEGKAP